MFNKQFILMGLFLALFSSISIAQEVQWASEVVGFSSEYNYDKIPMQYTAAQILGKPSVTPDYGESPCAWTPRSKSNPEGEWIKVGFENPMEVSQVVVAELISPGSINGIWLYDEKGKDHQVYRNRDPQPIDATGNLFVYKLEKKTNYKVTAVKVSLATYKIDGYNQIDAIGICDEVMPVTVDISIDPEAAEMDEPEHLGVAVNSEASELCPVISVDGKMLYFTREDHPDNIGFPDRQDIWFSTIGATGAFQEAQNIGAPLNNDMNNALSAVLPDGQHILLINAYLPDGTLTKGVSIAVKEGTEWAYPTPLEIDDFYNNSPYGEYFLAANGKVLILAMQREEGYGGKDIHVSYLREDGTWTAPENIGGVVNTGASEATPFLAADGKTLYFSSSGHPGYGDNDVFVSQRLDDGWTNWSEPINLGPVLNTPGFDAYYSIPASGEYAYFVSTHEDNATDIFRAKLPEKMRPNPVVLVYGKVINAKTKEPIGTNVSYESLIEGEELGIARSNATTGDYQIVLPAGAAYSFLASAEGFISINENIDLNDLGEYKEIEVNLELVPLEKGQAVRLNNVFFDVNKYDLKEEAYTELNRLVKVFEENPSLIVEIAGHTDSDGSSSSNRELSNNRAKAVHSYLIEKGVPEDKITYKGYGEDEPVESNDTDEGKALNRRVEFVIVNID